jgi:hypothetical protein
LRQPGRSLCHSCAGSRGSSLRRWSDHLGPWPVPGDIRWYHARD